MPRVLVAKKKKKKEEGTDEHYLAPENFMYVL
jgi:hypothetical protein